MNHQAPSWQQIEVRYRRAATLVGAARASYLASLRATDSTIHDAVVLLLAESPTEAMSSAKSQKVHLARTRGEPVEDLTGWQIGNIRLEGPIGEGGTGTVYRGFDRKLRRRVAVKTLHQDVSSPSTRARFMREARILSSLNHPRICQVYDLISWHGRDVLVLELINGQTLRRAGGRLSYDEKLRVAEAVAEAIAVAHREQIIHRDLKPDNIMITSRGEVKVLDFGIARSLAPARSSDAQGTLSGSGVEQRNRSESSGEERVDAAARPTETKSIAGTLAYMSPEQARGERLSLATDLFSFGVLLQELFTGKRAVPELPLCDLIAWVGAGKTLPAQGIDREWATLITDLRRRVPRERPTAGQCLARIRTLIARPARRQRQRRQWIAAAGLAVALAGTVATVATVDHSHAVTRQQRETIKTLISYYEPADAPPTAESEAQRSPWIGIESSGRAGQSARCIAAVRRAARAIHRGEAGADSLVDASTEACQRRSPYPVETNR